MNKEKGVQRRRDCGGRGRAAGSSSHASCTISLRYLVFGSEARARREAKAVFPLFTFYKCHCLNEWLPCPFLHSPSQEAFSQRAIVGEMLFWKMDWKWFWCTKKRNFAFLRSIPRWSREIWLQLFKKLKDVSHKIQLGSLRKKWRRIMG